MPNRHPRMSNRSNTKMDEPPKDEVVQAVAKFVDNILKSIDDTRAHAAIGPAVYEQEEHARTGREFWYFVVAYQEHDVPMRTDAFKVNYDNPDVIGECRAAVMMGLALTQRGVVLHDFDQELRFAKFCNDIFPCDKSRVIYEVMLRELGEQ
jgi:hypothetical protein